MPEKKTLERARNHGSLAVSQPMDLVGIEPAYARGVLLVAPVSMHSSSASPTPEPYGYVMAVISIRQLVADGLPEASHDNLAIHILDLSTGNKHETLYESDNRPVQSELLASRSLRFADHDYQVDIRPSAAFMRANHFSVISLVVPGGLLSVLLSALLYVLVSQRQRALTLVEQRVTAADQFIADLYAGEADRTVDEALRFGYSRSPDRPRSGISKSISASDSSI